MPNHTKIEEDEEIKKLKLTPFSWYILLFSASFGFPNWVIAIPMSMRLFCSEYSRLENGDSQWGAALRSEDEFSKSQGALLVSKLPARKPVPVSSESTSVWVVSGSRFLLPLELVGGWEWWTILLVGLIRASWTLWTSWTINIILSVL